MKVIMPNEIIDMWQIKIMRTKKLSAKNFIESVPKALNIW
jgi:hypothetical protein